MYTTLVRLIECCREYYWNKIAGTNADEKVDTITRSIKAEFLIPIKRGSLIRLVCEVIKVEAKGFQLRFEIKDQRDLLYAFFEMVQVFYDPGEEKAVVP